jgi:signal transduction histidine kinase
MSHEIRTPLNAIIGMAYILLKTPLNKRQQDVLGKLDSASHLLLNLINDLLDFSKIEAGKMELESMPFTIDEVLNNLSELVMAEAGEKDLDILYQTSSDIPEHLIGDPLRLGQVLLNLLNNALKFTEKGHILLAVEVMKQPQYKHNIRHFKSKSICLKFIISDTGIGIKTDDINKLFSSFTQADNSTTRKFGGTGLGLSICKQLIQLMDGEIKVESIFGEGSTFSFNAIFAVDPATEYSSEIKKNIMPSNIQNTHVLVVDDNPLAQSIFQQMLVNFGFKVSLASSAQEGIDLLKQYSNNDPFKLILMDWNMPVMNGIQAAHIIKTELDLQVIPAIILVTAHANTMHIKDQMELDDFLIKPISQSVLYDSIITTCSKNKSEKMLYEIDHLSVIDLSNKRVLLTEDNKTNQEVASTLMQELKLQVTIANNGKEAVNAVKASHFDLVLMDLQMPEMDGFEATRLIRMDNKYQTLPIIAMTAHAMQGDRQKCLDAQMDDYLTKPIDVDKFFTLLKKWLGNNTEELATSINNVKKDINTKAIIYDSDFTKLKSINLKKALLRVRGNKELLLRLLINFKNQEFDMAKKIEVAILQKKQEFAKELVHSLKGESGTLEANRLFLACKNLESKLFEKDHQKQNEYLIDVSDALNEVLQDISLLEQENEKNKNTDVNVPEIKLELKLEFDHLDLQLKELAKLLKDNNLRAKTLAKNISIFLDSSEYSDQWVECTNALSDLDFELALKALSHLAKKMGIAL